MYCNHCGAQFQANQTFCSSCGQPIAQIRASVRPDVAKHVHRLGILWIAYSVWHLIGAGAVFAVGNFLIGRILEHHRGPENFVPAVLSMVAFFLLITSIAGLAAGWGLLQRESWGRTLALVLAVVSLLNVPFGTALGIYTLWALLPSDSAEQYRLLGTPA